MTDIIQISELSKTYNKNFKALNNVSLTIKKGEIFALLGPNGAGKTTLISLICSLANITSGSIYVDGFSTQNNSYETRKRIGLVPQELTLNMFESIMDTLKFSRGLFGLNPQPDYLEHLLNMLSLWDKKDTILLELSGGMKRRVMIAKALAHEPKVLFLDEPTAGVDVELRKDMWKQVRKLRESGVTIFLTTHYIEEAEEMADRVGIINKGRLLVVENKDDLLKKFSKKCLVFQLKDSITDLPKSLQSFNLSLTNNTLTYDYNATSKDTCISDLFAQLRTENILYYDVQSKKQSLEDIFVDMVHNT